MHKIRYEREHLPEKNRQTVVAIVDEVNRLYDTSLTPETSYRRLKLGLEAIPSRLGRGQKPTLPVPIDGALATTISSYIKLACSQMNKIPNRVTIVGLLKSCLEPGSSALKDFENLFKRLYPSFAINVSITTGSTALEIRRAVCTTYNNINIWFDTLKAFLVNNGFTRNRLDDEDGEGELVFPVGQLNCIVNLDESGLILDGNHSKTGGQSSTRYGPADLVLSQGADRTNKSSVRITIMPVV